MGEALSVARLIQNESDRANALKEDSIAFTNGVDARGSNSRPLNSESGFPSLCPDWFIVVSARVGQHEFERARALNDVKTMRNVWHQWP